MGYFSEPRGEGSCHLRRYRMMVTVAPAFHSWNLVAQSVLLYVGGSMAMILSAINAEARNVPDKLDEETEQFLWGQGCARWGVAGHCAP